MKEEKVIDRLLRFVKYLKEKGYVKSKSDFERSCGLSHNYLHNTLVNTKSSIGTDHLAKIHDKYPMLNLTWVITGKGSMISLVPDIGYKEAYFTLRGKIEELQRIAQKL